VKYQKKRQGGKKNEKSRGNCWGQRSTNEEGILEWDNRKTKGRVHAGKKSRIKKNKEKKGTGREKKKKYTTQPKIKK